MPKRTDIKSICIIGAGPIVIGQACEFDYSGTQACKALKEEGYRVVLINSNPATIMTDPDLADATYIEPITPDVVAKILEIAPSKVFSVASFYTMYKKEPTGKHFIQICRTLSCQLRGAEQVTKVICDKLNIGLGETSPDNKFTVMEVECLGSCGTAPMIQINDDYYENLTRSKIHQIIDKLD